MQTLFPEYLNVGSSGPAVMFLQQLLLAMNYGFAELVCDGVYGEQTAEAVRRLQVELGVEADGNFGPATRETFKSRKGIDINMIPVPTTCCVSPTGTSFHPPITAPIPAKDEVPTGTH